MANVLNQLFLFLFKVPLDQRPGYAQAIRANGNGGESHLCSDFFSLDFNLNA